MAFDPQLFFMQGLGGLLGGVLGVSVGAWLTGLHRVKGELTGRAEKLDAILAEVRASAKATELSKIAARTEGIDAIVHEVAETARASESTKIATRLEKLDQILPEVRAVTETQKRIEATVAGGEWDRQWRLNQMREAYSRLLAAVYGLQDYFHLARSFAGPPESHPEAEARDAHDLYRKHAAEFKTAAALTRIFAGGRATAILDSYEHAIEARLRIPKALQAQQALKDLAQLHADLIQAARYELHV